MGLFFASLPLWLLPLFACGPVGGLRDGACRVLSMCPYIVGLKAQNTVTVITFFLQSGSLPGIKRQALTDVYVDAQEQIKNALLKMDLMCEQRLA